uniref:Carotene 7,8-desaturase n=1 Tax=mine drainage metagenome TaxID=410659 RepID=E6PYZ4_9ZZZZ
MHDEANVSPQGKSEHEQQNPAPQSSSPNASQNSVLVVGAGVAGLSAACALADAGFQVTLVERRGYLGGRASSYLHPSTGEVIDNCQHVLFGCCTNLIDLYKRLGVADKIFWDSRMTLIEPGGRRSVLEPANLPAPLHGLPSILTAKCFTVSDKLSLLWAFTCLMFTAGTDPQRSLFDWIESHLQSSGSIKRFWELVIASALNADLDQIALPYAHKVIRELFMNSARAGAMGMSKIPLSDLYAGAASYLESRRGRILLNTNIREAAWSGDQRCWTLKSNTTEFSAEHLVLALPFEATAKLLPAMPRNPQVTALEDSMKKLVHWPICSVHLWFDREITELDHAVLLDRDIHWMYHKSRWQPSRLAAGSYVELVISASRGFAALSREQALHRATTQLAEFFPAVRSARLLKSTLVKEVRATFGVPPGIDDLRPTAASPWPQCFLAGDWVQTGWPATMEGAVRSGYLAAEALCHSLGDPRGILVPDLAPTGLMKIFG